MFTILELAEHVAIPSRAVAHAFLVNPPGFHQNKKLDFALSTKWPLAIVSTR
jgi:hypothetical protein